MRLAILLLCLPCCSLARNSCDERSVAIYYKKPIYEFSMGFLDRVSQDTDGHFVCSPINAWLQLVNLAEGARGKTLEQIWNVTRYHGKPCMQRTLRKILNREDSELSSNYKTQSLMIVDKFLAVNKHFKKKVERSSTVKVAALNFDTPYASADIANGIIEEATGISDTLEPYDFNLTSLILADAAKFKSAWSQPFDPVFTTRESFYYGTDLKGEVRMMSQTGYFNHTKLKAIHAEVLELPCIDEEHSMLIFLPTKTTIKDIFFYLKRIRLTTLFNLFKQSKHQLINVRLPRFKINSDLDNLAELINDMGVSYIFNPDKANLKGISQFPIQVNGIKQVVEIDVTEEGVSADVAQFYIKPEGVALDFIANRPFAFMLVDRPKEIILFGGVYAIPSVY